MHLVVWASYKNVFPMTSEMKLTVCMAMLQSRAEDYSETLAFVRLLNALWRSSGLSIQDGGRPYAHFSQFVLNSVLVPIGRRHYK